MRMLDFSSIAEISYFTYVITLFVFMARYVIYFTLNFKTYLAQWLFLQTFHPKFPVLSLNQELFYQTLNLVPIFLFEKICKKLIPNNQNNI